MIAWLKNVVRFFSTDPFVYQGAAFGRSVDALHDVNEIYLLELAALAHNTRHAMNEQQWLASDDPAAMLRHVFDGPPSRPRLQGMPGAVSDRKLRLWACACCRQVWHLLTDNSPCQLCGEFGRLLETAGDWKHSNPCTDCKGSGRINRSRRAVEVAERYADAGDGQAPYLELVRARDQAHGVAGAEIPSPHMAAAECCHADARVAADRVRQCAATRAWVAGAAQAALLRDIVGNPFRPWMRQNDFIADAPLPGKKLSIVWQSWLTPTVLALAEAANAERVRKCGRCIAGQVIVPGTTWAPSPCPDCGGSGYIDGGTLDPDRLGVLADALEEAGCADEFIVNHLRGMQPFYKGERLACFNRPEELAHVRGCWALDLVRGKD